MFSFLTKKRISTAEVARAYCNTIVGAVEEGFDDIAELINNDPEFVDKPQLTQADFKDFLMVIIAGNFNLISTKVKNEEDLALKEEILLEYGEIFNLESNKIIGLIDTQISFIKRVNFPSKNILYGMSKAVFHKYKLSGFQEDYFKEVNNPNPLLLKRLDGIIENFIWDWDDYLKKYRLIRSA